MNRTMLFATLMSVIAVLGIIHQLDSPAYSQERPAKGKARPAEVTKTLDDLSRALDSETLDPAWAPTTVKAIHRNLSESVAKIEGVVFEDLEIQCRTSLCRVSYEVDTKGSDSVAQAIEDAYLEFTVAAGLPVCLRNWNVIDGTRIEHVIYCAREGFELPNSLDTNP